MKREKEESDRNTDKNIYTGIHMIASGKIIAPVDIEDPATVLCENTLDVTALCSSPKINPAARFKPIRHSSYRTLDPAQRKGEINDNARGVYYGVRCAAPQNKLYELHGADYSYEGVRPDEDWSRLDDFVDYFHNAWFNPAGDMGTDGIADNGIGCDVTIECDPETPESCMDVAAIMREISTDVAFRLENSYPCALVSYGTTHKARALWNVSAKDTGPAGNDDYSGFTTLRHEEAWYRRWRVLLGDLGAPVGTELKVSVFFIHRLTDPSGTGYDFRQWTEVREEQLFTGIHAFTCPGAVDRSVTVRPRMPRGLEVTSVSLVGDTLAALVYPADGQEAPAPGVSYTVTVIVYDADGTEAARGAQEYAPDETSHPGPVELARHALDLKGSYRVRWHVRDSRYPGVDCNSGGLTLTV